MMHALERCGGLLENGDPFRLLLQALGPDVLDGTNQR
jgi:hypothetical protein